jgi:hypothetical protein
VVAVKPVGRHNAGEGAAGLSNSVEPKIKTQFDGSAHSASLRAGAPRRPTGVKRFMC